MNQNTNIFEKASRLNIRISTERGVLSVEDLWDLPLTGKVSLDALAVRMDAQLKATSTVSFVVANKKPDEALVVQFEIVKHIIAVRLEEKQARAKSEVTRARKQRLLEVLENKQNEALSATSIEDLKKEIAELEAEEQAQPA